MLGVYPQGALAPIHEAALAATRAIIGRDARFQTAKEPWNPHVTLCYSTGRQPQNQSLQHLERNCRPARSECGPSAWWSSEAQNACGTGITSVRPALKAVTCADSKSLRIFSDGRHGGRCLSYQELLAAMSISSTILSRLAQAGICQPWLPFHCTFAATSLVRCNSDFAHFYSLLIESAHS